MTRRGDNMKEKKKIVICMVIILSLIISYLISLRIVNNRIGIDVILNNDIYLWILSFIAIFYILCHLIIPIKKIYNFIFNKRWAITLFILVICILGKFNMSSYGVWNSYIQPNNDVQGMHPLIGEPIPIRSDEWLVNLPETLSQYYNNYNKNNNLSRATDTDFFVASMFPIKDLLAITRPFQFLYLFGNNDYGNSFFWCGRIIILISLTFEFILVISKGNKRSAVLGTSLIALSTPVIWFDCFDLFIGGEGAITCFYYLLKSNNLIKSICWSLLLSICILLFVFVLYPAWFIPLSYIYGAIAIYILIKHIKDKNKNSQLWYLLIPFAIVIGTVLYFYFSSKSAISSITNTVYPGARFVTGGNGYSGIYNYVFNLFMKVKDISNPCEAAMFFSFFPLVYFLIGNYFVHNRKKLDMLVVILTVLSLFFAAFMFVGFPTILAKYTFLYMCPVQRVAVMYAYLLVIIICLIHDKIEYKHLVTRIVFNTLAIVCSIFVMDKARVSFPDYISNNMYYFGIIINSILSLLLVNSDIKIINIIFISLALIGFFSIFITVKPIMKGVNSFYDKPLAKELSKYRDNDKDAIWISTNDITTANYLLANGLKVINSVNHFPNLELWHKLDPEEKYNEVYNRFAHVQIELTKEDTNFELVQADYFRLNLNSLDVCTLNIDYIASRSELEKFSVKNKVSFVNKYYEDGAYIYAVECK